ncbi:acyl-CoA dehydrogenase family protein [Aneurinibacillus thermoaerophilus]|uniref:Acyl-CoA dehydrogenase n=1 Tax=Aneurinibacillus thermoaerophilus TaxID=143495 RepID=A0A1G7XCS6_ANETH|nr:acyl-CoA dehydrogenase family protein [Aneurinibacillus thermoaerophilus]MED0678262.1 acyl-CoA dehydrogenase family protein [Aneurinibacillus thermoaerophilus]MED0736212.1 acyl-CoA dehydrogenase family protein [Aneurinibacillus thermoaerophilus]MED0758838.1 acyl-CoA dehydrogenase family protein [Aneurinibacillus thermoaerophilus]MED0760485.1 acyl-CoA dehydrogenase family protein [Aneurinibacillus thermoaerophilus]MED0764501.1 acyl-CoA dehydrogenase family protein [Aneurinibacillus thermoaer
MSIQETMPKGGQFILEEADFQTIFTPEDFNEEQRMIARMTRDFIEGEVVPKAEEIEKLNYELTVKLLRQAGELGLLGADIPEVYGGAALDKISSSLIGENMVRGGSFSLSHGAHVGIGTLPIVFFGTPEQKAKYLPSLATGEKIAAYCLTEPSSGSDALSAKTTAVLNQAGTHYILNGTKQFITNAGFADIFIVYAKVDGEKFTAFIVEKDFLGVSTGPEEKKMGIKGSSTRPLILDNVEVPIENVLGEIGKGHKIAFNILNIGRYKLGIGAVGASKWAIELAAQYAKERKQFKTELANFPLIQNKLADMAIRTYVNESITYRTGGYLEAATQYLNLENYIFDEAAKAIEEHAIEYSIVKVFGSEALDFVADEGVQIHGGYGYISEYKIEQIYRDSRINRIFEGTNEVNRLLIPGTLLKRAMQGRLPLMEKLQTLQKELTGYIPSMDLSESTELLETESKMLESVKKLFLMVGGAAVQKYMQKIEQEQEILENLSNMMITIYALESALLRAKKTAARKGEAAAQMQIDMTRAYFQEVWGDLDKWAKEALAAISEGDTLRTQLSIVKKLMRMQPMNTFALKRSIAKRILEAGQYTTGVK